MSRRIAADLTRAGVFATAVFLLLLPPLYLVRAERSSNTEAISVLTKYLKLLYARDLGQAYRLISSEDQKLKDSKAYARERGSFTGFTLEVARELADLVQLRPIEERSDGGRLRVKAAMKLPDASDIAPLLMDWDEDRLNSLPATERRRILAALEERKRRGQIKMIEGEEGFTLVRETKGWKVFLDWASGIRINFAAAVASPGSLDARALVTNTVTVPNELFTVSYKIRNPTEKDVFARILHRVEPQPLAQYLDIVQCALLLPVRVPPGEEQEYTSTYLLRGDVPDGAKELNVTYEFKLEH